MANYTGTVGDDRRDAYETGGRNEKNKFSGLGGDDTLKGGDRDDTLDGGDGDDQLYGRGGDDLLIMGAGVNIAFGGRGDDRVVAGAFSGFFNFDGGAGADTVDYSQSTNFVTVDLFASIGGGNAEGDVWTSVENVVGTAFADTISAGSGGSDDFTDHRLKGGAGDDSLRVATDGQSVLDGGDGNDRIQTLYGASTLIGGAGDDSLTGGGRDPSNRSSDRLHGGEGSDHLDGGVGDDVLSGGAGNDFFFDTEGKDTVQGGGGDDSAAVFSWSGRYDMGAGNDTIYGFGNNDSFQGGSGDDQRITIDGGTGVDTLELYVEDGQAVIVDLEAGVARNSKGFVAVIRNVENVEGDVGDDRITGSGAANYLVGEAGDDVLRGGGGADSLFGDGRAGGEADGADRLDGGAGSDQLTGGTGADLFIFRSAAHSGPGADRDAIMDFSSAQDDRMDLSKIDAKVGASGNQAFSFIGTADFSGKAGELRYYVGDGAALVLADIDGDREGDLVIHLAGIESLEKGDFIL